MTGCQAVSYALALVPAGLLPATVGLAGSDLFCRRPAFWGSCIWSRRLGSGWRPATAGHAGCLRTSFLYLPAILILLLLNPVPY